VQKVDGGMIPNILQVLVKAVRERRCLAIRYHDQSNIRVIEPHAIYTADNSEITVDAFQTRGYTASGRPPPFWRPFRVKEISAVSLMNEQFAVRHAEGFNANRPRYQKGLIALVKSVPASPQARSSEARAASIFANPLPQMVYPPKATGADIGPPRRHLARR
jgi:predicted DNA-binding transcriptional regulator YafY